MSQWVPILSPTDPIAARAWETVEAIADAVWTRSYPPLIELKRRHATHEESLLYGYMALSRNDPEWFGRASDSLNGAIEGASMMWGNYALFGGLCGTGWTVEHLSSRLGEAFEGDCSGEAVSAGAGDDSDPLQEVDAAVLRSLRKGPWRGAYDLISGLVGFGVYFLERAPAPAAAEGVRLVLDQLEACSERTDQGLTWFSGPDMLPPWQREICPEGYYNLGVAHGIPGVLHFLSETAAAGIEVDRAQSLLAPAVDWLVANQLPIGRHCRFSSWVAPGQTSDSRLTWCYGDLGILAVMLQIARQSGRADWNDFAHGLMENSLIWPTELTGITDAPLCHGAAGLAHIFNRVYQTEGDPRCREQALFWIEQALAMRRAAGGVGGYLAYTRPDPRGSIVWEPTPALLDGAIGVALMLLAALTPIEPEWDRMLLVSGKQRGRG